MQSTQSSMIDWNIDQIIDFLKEQIDSLDIQEEYWRSFIQNGSQFINLDDETLRDELQVENEETRLKIIRIIQEQNENFQNSQNQFPQDICNFLIQEQQINEYLEIGKVLPLIQNIQLSINDYTQIDQSYNYDKSISQMTEYFQNYKKLDGQTLIFILFDFIKRKLTFDELTDKLIDITGQNKIQKIQLFNYMMLHADEDLRQNLLYTCSQFMPIPLLSWNCWEQNEDGSLKSLIWKEIFYIYEKFKSLIQFKIAEDNDNSPKGCSEFLNNLFGKDFILNQDSLINNQTIEVQFDFNCEKTEYLVIADTHGILDLEILKKIFFLFDGFIIHSNNDKDYNKVVDETIQFIKKQNPKSEIFSIVHDKKYKDNFLFFSQNNHLKIQLKTFKLNQSLYKNQLNKIQEKLNNFYFFDNFTYINNPNLRINSKKQLIQFIKNFDDSNAQTFENYIDQIQNLIQSIIKQDDLTSKIFLPMMNSFQIKCNIENQLMVDNQQEKTNQLKQQQDKNDQDMKNIQETEIIKKFIQLIEQQSCIKVQMFLTSLIKQYIESLTIPLQKERTKYIEQNKGSQDYKEKIKEYDDQIEKKRFSQEFILREIYYLSLYSKQNSKSQQFIKQYYNQLLLTSQAFEVVDGDTLEFINELKNFICQNDENIPVLVVSVVGPQSSGKSFIMNYLFGTLFMSSAGRCTKGIYGSLITYIQNNKKYKILILDTEGIQSAEARNHQFDKRIIYYILCVSHVILMCNKGEMNQKMTEIVKLVADAIQNTKENHINNPSIFIIMNMIQKVDQQTQISIVNNLQQDIDLDQQDQNKQVFRITEDFIVPLGQAFIKKPYGPNSSKISFKSDSAYSKQISQFGDKILEKIQQIDQNQSTQYTLKQWCDFAYKFWEFSKTYDGINDYNTLAEKKDDQKLIKKIEEYVEKQLENDWQDKIKPEIKSQLENIYNQYDGGNWIKFENINVLINETIDNKYFQLLNEMNTNFNKFTQDEGISVGLRDKRMNTISIRINQYKTNCKNYFNKSIAEFQEKKAKDVGLAKMHEQTKDILNKQLSQITVEQAEKYFIESWNLVEKDVIDVLKTNQSIKESIFKLLRHDFSLNQLDPSITDLKQDTQWSQKFSDVQYNQQEFITFIYIKMQNNFLKFTGQQITPNIQKIFKFQNLTQKNYVNQYQIDKNIIRNQSQYQHYNYIAVIYNNKIHNDFLKQIQDIFLKEDNFLNQIQNLFFNSQKEDQYFKYQKNFNTKLKKYNIKFKGNLQMFIPDQFQGLKKEQFMNKISEKFDNVLNDSNNFEYMFGQYFDISVNVNNYFSFSQEKYLQGYLNVSQEESIIIDSSFYQQLNSLKKLNLIYYLNYLINYGYQKYEFNIILEAAKDLFDFLDLKQICFDIQKQIIIIYRKDTQYHNTDLFTYIKNLKDFNSEEQEKLACEFNRISQKQIRAIVKQTQIIIDKINDEIECFSYQVSTQGQYMIYLIAQTYTHALATAIEIIYERQPLKQIQKRKSIEKELFIAKITQNDKQIDIALAKKIGNEMIQFYYLQNKNFQMQEFKDNMNSEKGTYNILNTFEEYTKECIQFSEDIIKPNFQLNNNIQDQIKKYSELFTQPVSYLEEKFAQKFDKTINKYLEQSQKDFIKNYNDSLLNFNNYLKELKDQFLNRNLKESSLIFRLDNEEVNTKNKEYLNKGALKYICQIFLQTWKKGQEIKIDQKKISCLPYCQLPLYSDIKTELDEKFRKKLVSLFENDEQINNIYEFLDQLFKIIDNKLKVLQDIKLQQLPANKDFININKDDLLGDFMIQFKLQFMGCKETCPLCKRQCDQQHKDDFIPELQIHKCSSGHQLQAFSGSYSLLDKKAITMSCDELADEQIITYKGEDIKWINFKSKPIMKNWQFDVEKQKKELFRANNMKIWNLLGKKICESYNLKGIPIVYQEATLQKPVIIQKIHFILMLDDSGSMSGKPWSELIQAVKLFFQQLSDKPQIRNNVKVSVIKHNTDSKIIFQNQTPSIALANQILFESGGNDFSKPLMLAYQICQQTHSQFDKILYYFMSDGICSYPTDAINLISSFQREKLEFQAVAFGSFDSNVLNQMASKFKNGKLTKAPNFEALKETFVKIVPNI